jgi:hypothetical protein
LCGTALVELGGTLLHLGLGVEGVSAKVKGSVTQVTDEFSNSDILRDSKLEKTNEGDDLEMIGRRVSSMAANPLGYQRRKFRCSQCLLEDGFRSRRQVSGNSKHADTSVLDLDETETVELFLVTISDKAKRIEESKKSLVTEFVLESLVGGDRSAGRLLGRGKGREQ